MKTLILFAVFFGVLFTSPLEAQFRRLKSTRSNLDFFVTNRGILFNSDNAAGLNWPRGSSDHYIFGGGFWFGAKKYVAPAADAEPWSFAGSISDSLVALCGNPITNRLLVGTLRNGVYSRTNTENHWTFVALPKPKPAIGLPSIVLLPNGKELIAADSGLFMPSSSSQWIAAPGVSNERITAVSAFGAIATFKMRTNNTFSIYIPNSDWTNWTVCHTFIFSGNYNSRFTQIASSNDNKVIVTSTNTMVWISTNSGSTWDSLPKPSSSVIRGIGISPFDGSIFVASDAIYQSFDLCKTWVERNTGLSNHIAIAFKAAYGSTGFAVATGSGIYILPFDSLEKGSWVDHSKGLPPVGIVGLDLDPTGKLHAVLNDRSIFTQFIGQAFRPGMTEVCELGYNPNTGDGWFTPGENNAVKESADTLGKYFPYLSTSFRTKTGLPMVFDSATPPYRWPVWSDANEVSNIRTNFRFGSRISSVSERDALAQSGARPVFISEEDIINTYTDVDTTANPEFKPGSGYPLGLNVQESIYSWSFGRYRDLIFLRYRVNNSSTDTLKDCFFAPAFDPDLGDHPLDGSDNNSVIDNTDTLIVHRALGDASEVADFVKTPALLNMAYQSTTPDSKEYGVLGIAFVETPVVADGKLINNGDSLSLGGYGPNSLYRKNQLGLSTFRNWTIINDPNPGPSRYDFISNGQKDHKSGSAFDVRMMLSTGPFDLLPGASVTTTVAIGIARPSTTNKNENLDSLISLMAFAHRFFATPIQESGDPNSITLHHFEGAPSFGVKRSDSPTILSLELTPNPVSSTATLRYALNQRETVNITIYDILGRAVSIPLVNKTQDAGEHEITIDVRNLNSGNYSCRLVAGEVEKMVKIVIVR